MFLFSIDFVSPLPLYRQLIHLIKLEIISGRLNSGDQLPPIRELAKLLKLNPNTVAKAYYTLESEGFTESRRGSGNWVSRKEVQLDSLRRSMVEDEWRIFLEKVLKLGATARDIRALMERDLTDDQDHS